MIYKIVLINIILSFFSCSIQEKPKEPLAEKGVLDLRQWDFEKYGKLDLYGDWEFYYGEFLLREDFKKNTRENPHLIPIPSLWNGYDWNGSKLPGFGYATYRLTVKVDPKYLNQIMGLRIGDMYSSYRLFVNGKLIASNGKPGKIKEETVAQWLPVVRFINIESEETEFILHIANYNHRKAGTWAFLEFGNPDEIVTARERAMAFELFLFGSLIIMSFYHFGLYALRKNNRSVLYFGIFCFLTGFRVMVTGERSLVNFFPLSFEGQLKIEYLSLSLGIPAFSHFLIHSFPEIVNRKAFYIPDFFLILFSIIPLFTTGEIYSYTAIPVQLNMLLVAILFFYYLIKANRLGKDGAFSAILGMIIFFICGVNDALYNNELIQTGNLYPFGLFIFIFSQSFILSLLFSKSFRNVENLSIELTETNRAYTRFVPREFLNFLNKKSILDIQLGDQVQKEMTILFSDIRSFTTLSEQMSPEENFNFINSYLSRMNPIIKQNNGFIDKYIGDAIMALFASTPADAIRAAIHMQQEILKYNRDRVDHNFPIIKIGVGLHSGKLMLGTIGGDDRMEGTVISDAVNLAARLEGLTKVYGSLILTSEETFLKANGKENFKYRRLGKARVKGKQDSVVIIDILDGQSEFWLDVYLQTKEDFEKALDLYESKDFKKAGELFDKVLDVNPSDVAARFLYQKSGYYETHGTPEDWDGTESV